MSKKLGRQGTTPTVLGTTTQLTADVNPAVSAEGGFNPPLDTGRSAPGEPPWLLLAPQQGWTDHENATVVDPACSSTLFSNAPTLADTTLPVPPQALQVCPAVRPDARAVK